MTDPNRTDATTTTLSTVTSEKPGCITSSISYEMSPNIPKEKGTLSLSCVFKNNGNCDRIEWRIAGFVRDKNSTKITITHLDYTSQMNVSSLSHLDAVNMSCHQGNISVVFNITVQPLPVLEISPLTLAVREQDNTNITCRVTNADKITNTTGWNFTWCFRSNVILDKQTILSRGDVSVLQLTLLTMENSGDYSCSINGLCNNEGPISRIKVFGGNNDNFCDENVDENGILWEESPHDFTNEQPCPERFTGVVTRHCNSTGWGVTNMTNCIRGELIQAEQELDNALDEGSDVEKSKVIENVIDTIADVTSGDNSEPLSSGDLIKTTDILGKMVDVLGNNVKVNESAHYKFVGIIDGMLSQDTEAAWAQTDTDTDASNMFTIVDSLGDAVGGNLQPGEPLEIKGENIVIKIEKPSTNIATFNASGSEISLDFTTSGEQNVSYTAARYITIGNLLPKGNSQEEEFTSEVLALSLSSSSGVNTRNLSSPVILTFDTDELANDSNLTSSVTYRCVYWNMERLGGDWSEVGCRWIDQSCQCTHLTSFAVIMSPVTTSDSHVLRIISFIGCILSLVSTVATMAVYLRFWRYVKSDRSRLLLNLCTALTVAYVVFIIGIEKPHDNTLCTAIAALLHYFFLATFCLMLAEGIEILMSVKPVFHTKSKLRWFLLLGWGLPAFVVAVTVGVTFDDEYHSEFHCWLTLSNGVIYSFVAPAVCIILVNIVILFIVVKTIYSSQLITTKRKQKIMTGVRSVLVLLPVLGITWLFGIVSVNDDLIVFQYLFALTNSLQGFFIFLSYCVFNPSIRQALTKRIKKFDSSKTGSANTSEVFKKRPWDESKDDDEFDITTEIDFRLPRPTLTPFILYRRFPLLRDFHHFRHLEESHIYDGRAQPTDASKDTTCTDVLQGTQPVPMCFKGHNLYRCASKDTTCTDVLQGTQPVPMCFKGHNLYRCASRDTTCTDVLQGTQPVPMCFKGHNLYRCMMSEPVNI